MISSIMITFNKLWKYLFFRGQNVWTSLRTPWVRLQTHQIDYEPKFNFISKALQPHNLVVSIQNIIYFKINHSVNQSINNCTCICCSRLCLIRMPSWFSWSHCCASPTVLCSVYLNQSINYFSGFFVCSSTCPLT